MDAPRTPASPAATPVHEHEFEAEHGLPEPLPPGERLLWQGTPDWRVLARHAFHVPALTLYFGAILALRMAVLVAQGDPLEHVARSTLQLLPLAAIAVGLVLLLAWLTARTAVYTLTDRRVVMRVGIVLTVTFNLPLACIEAADLHALRRGSGDIALGLQKGTRIAWLQLWPHVRPWRVSRTQPMLRALPDASLVATLLVRAWQTSRGRAAAAVAAPSRLPASSAAVPAREAAPAMLATAAPLRPAAEAPVLMAAEMHAAPQSAVRWHVG